MKEKREIQKAVAYGIGYVCGKHNLNMTKKDIKQISKDYVLGLEKQNHEEAVKEWAWIGGQPKYA